MNKGSHQLLAGDHLSHRQEPDPAQEPGEKAGTDRGGMPRFGGHFQGEDRMGGGMGRGRPPHGGMQDSERDARYIAAVFSISGAFLDSVSKFDTLAQSWLSQKANQWQKKPSNLKM